MALELEGTLRQKLGVQSGTSARGPWAKQEFILEYPDGNFTAQACFTAWGQDKVAELDKYQVGDRINDLQIWRIAPAGQAQAAPAAAPVYDAPAPTLDDMPGDNEDDLPF